jgi:hypothetical protein
MYYAHFGDVVSFDTNFGINKESGPFGILSDSMALEKL